MADWTANSTFGAGAPRDAVFRSRREPKLRPPEPPAGWADSLRAEPRHPHQPDRIMPVEEEPRIAPAAAALARYNASQGGPLAKARLATFVGGGALSLLLVGGLGVWGYKLVLREVMGLPVVTAEAGPMRVLPADPGGEVAPSQGLAVNAIPAAGLAAPPSDVLVLAPQGPGLAEEDMEVVQTMAEADEVVPEDVFPAVTPTPAAAPAVGPEPMTLAAPPAVASLAAPPAEALAPVATLAPQPSAPVETAALGAPLPTPAPAATVAAAAVEPAAAVVPAAPVAAAAAAPSVRPPSRPALLGMAPQMATLWVVPAETAPAPAAAPVVEMQPVAAVAAAPAPAPSPEPAAVVAPGTHLVQLGAFDSAEIAAAEWDRLQASFGAFLGTHERVVQETQSDGRTFWRLRATGFANRAEARALCAALTAEGAACIPVTVD